MEGGGTRLGRASSRYGSTQQQQVFDGPVRKWKKQWVSNAGDGKLSNTPPLLLCRWTPLSATAAEGQPPRRRFRYTPIVRIEKEKRESNEKARHEEKENQSSANMGNDDMLGNPSVTQEASEGQSDSNRSLDDDMDFGSNRKNPNLDLDGEEET